MEIIKEKPKNVLFYMYEGKNDSYMLYCELNSHNKLIKIHEMILDKEEDEYFDMGVPHNNIRAQEKGTTLTEVLNILKTNYIKCGAKLVDIKYFEGIN